MRGHSKMESPQNWLISDPTPPCNHFSLHVTGEIVTNFENSSTEKDHSKMTQCNVST